MYFEFLLTLIIDISYQINLFISKLNNLLIGAPGKSRTSNLQIRSLAFYPIELRARVFFDVFSLCNSYVTIFEEIIVDESYKRNFVS